MDEVIRACMEDIQEILKLKQLNVELLQTLELILLWFKDYHQKTGLPIPRAELLDSLLNKADSLIDEVCSPLFYNNASHQTTVNMNHETDDKLPEPLGSLYKGAKEFFKQ